MRSTPRRQPLRRRLEHEPHRRADAAQRTHVRALHHARVEMWQQPRLLEHHGRRPAQVLERRVAPERCELVPRRAVAQLGLVAEREQRLAAPDRGTRARDRQHLVDRHVGGLAATRRPRERAVVTDVPAELRQRDEDLRRVRDQPAVALVAERPGLGAQLVERPVEQLHRRSLRCDPRQTRSTAAIPSVAATSTPARAAAAASRRARVPGADTTAAPATPRVTPARVSAA